MFSNILWCKTKKANVTNNKVITSYPKKKYDLELVKKGGVHRINPSYINHWRMNTSINHEDLIQSITPKKND